MATECMTEGCAQPVDCEWESVTDGQCKYDSATKQNMQCKTAKITKAGVLNSFSAFLIVGNRAGLIGHGKGKSNDAKKAVERAYTNAMSNLIAIELFDGHTIPHDVEHRFKKTKVNLYSGKQGTGVIANELVSTICNLAGIQNLTAKVHGVHHKRNTVRAVFEALELVYTVDEVKRTRGADLRLY